MYNYRQRTGEDFDSPVCIIIDKERGRMVLSRPKGPWRSSDDERSKGGFSIRVVSCTDRG